MESCPETGWLTPNHADAPVEGQSAEAPAAEAAPEASGATGFRVAVAELTPRHFQRRCPWGDAGKGCRLTATHWAKTIHPER